MTYLQYLLTDHWQKLRHAAFSKAGYRCEFCRSGERLRGHHLKYRNPLTTCTTDDIMCLCEKHHDLWHVRHPSKCQHERHHVLLYLANPKPRALRRIKKREAKARKKQIPPSLR